MNVAWQGGWGDDGGAGKDHVSFDDERVMSILADGRREGVLVAPLVEGNVEFGRDEIATAEVALKLPGKVKLKEVSSVSGVVNGVELVELAGEKQLDLPRSEKAENWSQRPLTLMSPGLWGGVLGGKKKPTPDCMGIVAVMSTGRILRSTLGD